MITADLRCYDTEKKKEDASSPRGVIEACMNSMYKGSESVDNSTSESETSSSDPKTHTRWRKFVNVWKVSPIKRLPLIPPKTISKLSNKKSSSSRDYDIIDLNDFESSWRNFSLLELQTATCNFSPG